MQIAIEKISIVVILYVPSKTKNAIDNITITKITYDNE